MSSVFFLTNYFTIESNHHSSKELHVGEPDGHRMAGEWVHVNL